MTLTLLSPQTVVKLANMKLPQRIVNISNKVRTQVDKAHLENIRINENNFTVIVFLPSGIYKINSGGNWVKSSK